MSSSVFDKARQETHFLYYENPVWSHLSSLHFSWYVISVKLSPFHID